MSLILLALVHLASFARPRGGGGFGAARAHFCAGARAVARARGPSCLVVAVGYLLLVFLQFWLLQLLLTLLTLNFNSVAGRSIRGCSRWRRRRRPPIGPSRGPCFGCRRRGGVGRAGGRNNCALISGPMERAGRGGGHWHERRAQLPGGFCCTLV